MKKKFLFLGLTGLLSLNILSSPVSAAVANISLENFNVIYDSEDPPTCMWRYRYAGNNGYENRWTDYSNAWSPMLGVNTNTEQINGVRCKQANGTNIETVRGDYFILNVRVKDYRSTSITGPQWNDFKGDYLGSQYLNDDMSILSVEMVGYLENNDYRNVYYQLVGYSPNGEWNPDWGLWYQHNGNNYTSELKVMSITQLRPIGSSDYSSQLSNLQSALSSINSSNNAINQSIQSLRDDIQAQTDQEQDHYDEEIQREEDKQDELESQADDLSLSTPATANPFASLFTSADCANLPTIAGWLGTTPDKIRVCSPYPSQIRPVIEFLSSAIVVGLLIRLYYSKLQGGYAS